jgi:hypothetical protein
MVLLALLLAPLLALALLPAGAGARKPNFLVIFADGKRPRVHPHWRLSAPQRCFVMSERTSFAYAALCMHRLCV